MIHQPRPLHRASRSTAPHSFPILTLASLLFCLAAAATALPPPPSQWNGVNYFPRYHQFYNMLNDWYATDSATGQQVAQLADGDMATMASNGFNFLHLYVYDSDWFGVGFNPMRKSLTGAPYNPPQFSPNNQWAALDDYLAKAESHGLYVGIHFVSKYPIDQLNGGIDATGATQMGQDFAEWADTFVSYFAARHQNIALWGLIYALGPIPDQPLSSWNAFFVNAYQGVYATAKGGSGCVSGGLNQVGINLGMQAHAEADGYHYSWDSASAQRTAKAMRDLNLCDPDIYMLQLYNASSADLSQSLANLTGAPPADGIAIPAAKILAVEYATSSSLAPSPYGNQIPTFGDAYTPTTDLAGQAQWINNTLCAFAGQGVEKTAYFGYYDAADTWAAPPFNYTGAALAWNGYWGLLPLDPNAAAKPSWSTLTSYFRFGSLACSDPAPPAVTLTANAGWVGAGYPLTLSWTAYDVRQLSLSPGIGALTPANVDACASLSASGCEGLSYGTKTVYPPNAGSMTYALTGTDSSSGGSLSASASVTVTVFQNPVVNAVTDSNYQGTLYASSTIIVWGSGFSPAGGNTVQLQRAGYPDVWLYEGDGHYYWDNSAGQINASLDGRAAPGVWNVTVRDASSAPSYPFQITIH